MTVYNVCGARAFTAIVRVIVMYLTGEVHRVTKYGHVDVTTVGGIEVVAYLSLTGGPLNSKVSL